MRDQQPLIAPELRLEEIAHRILDSGYIARQEYLEMMTLFLSDDNISDREKYLINQIFDDVRAGCLNFTN
jgi:hypothetical protein